MKWRIGDAGATIFDEDGKTVCTLHCRPLSNSKDKARARLIAAAPELLEALKTIQENIRRGYYQQIHPSDVDDINKAIAKAEGEKK